MSILSDIKMYSRFALGFRRFLGHTLSLPEAKAIVRQRMAAREANFLRLLERGIFNYPRSPYLPLFKLAQVELNDVRAMVRSKGLESTLRALREAGVYVTFEEFKGREPIVRNGQIFRVKAEDFDNPYLSYYYEAETGGTTGAGTRVGIDLDHLAANASFDMLGLHAHGVLDAPIAIWRGILPDSSGVNTLLRATYLGNIPKKWFSHITSRETRIPLKHRLATLYIVYGGRAFGVPLPTPEPVTLDQAAIVARWASSALKAHRACVIATVVSLGVRVSIAAQEEGLDLTGATFLLGGEPPTPAKVKAINQSGARCVPHYHSTEAGRIGMGCARPTSVDDVHFFKDGLALIPYARVVPGSEITVPAFHFTSLLLSTPKLMVNVEIDDYGVIETRSCGCPLEENGYTEHLSDIRSFRKLTGEGVTLVGSEMIRILEEVLPARFGGSSLDYQMMEEEDGQGLTRLTLLISPKLDIADDAAVIEVVLDALGRSNLAGQLTRGIWTQARTLRVKRQDPVWTSRGKLMPLHLLRRIPGSPGESGL